MSITIIPKKEQAYGQFNNGQIIENKPIGFPREGGPTKPYSSLFYWAYAEAKVDSTIGLHPHQGFEIMSFVLNGKIRHFDNQLNDWRDLKKGDVQIIRAGKGISHAEFMAKDSAMFQIWMDPDINKTMQQEATYDDYPAADFPKKDRNGLLVTTYTGTPDAPLTMDTPGVMIERWQLAEAKKEKTVDLESDKIYSVYVLNGEGTINGKGVESDAFIIIKNIEQLELTAENGIELFVITSPINLEYRTYGEVMQKRMG